jgi:hypothetical protein
MNADQAQAANTPLQNTCSAPDLLDAALGEELSSELLSLVSGGDGVAWW